MKWTRAFWNEYKNLLLWKKNGLKCYENEYDEMLLHNNEIGIIYSLNDFTLYWFI